MVFQKSCVIKYAFILTMVCLDEYFLESIAAVENDWILPKRNMLKELIKMKKHLQVNPVFLSWRGAVRVQPFFQELLESHPVVNVQCVKNSDKLCDVCSGRNATRSFIFQPLTYNLDTLDIREGKSSAKVYHDWESLV